MNSYFSNCKFGIGVISTKNTIVENCNFTDCEIGLTLNGCPTQDTPKTTNNTVRNCTFYKNFHGIYLCCLPNSYNNLIESCHFSKNGRGVLFDHLTNYVLVTKCNFTYNAVGLRIISNSANNYITGNVFFDNWITNGWTFCKDNYWDNGEKYGGNFWDDYNGTGIYRIIGTTNDTDNYPLSSSEFINQIISFFYSPELGLVEEDITFDASPSYPKKSITNFTWDFDDGGKSYEKITSHIFKDEGTYNVTLNISDGSRYDTFTKTIEIYNLSENKIIVNQGEKIQDAVNITKPGDTVFIKNGTYHENVIIDTPFISLIGESNNSTSVDANRSGNVITINAPYVTISRLKIKYSGEDCAGIKIGKYEYVTDSYNCIIDDCEIWHNFHGVYAQSTNNIKIVNNSFIYNEESAVCFEKTHSSIIKNNIIYDQIYHGIDLNWGSNWNLIENNEISYCIYGISTSYCNYVKIIKNEILYNTEGIRITDSIAPKVNYNNIYKNLVTGILVIGPLTIYNFKNNWWGTIFGPGGKISLLREKLIFSGDGGIKVNLKSIPFRFLSSFPWKMTKNQVNLD